MSGTRRRPIVRVRRPVGFPPEAIRLFVELERVKPARRFEDRRTLELARLLNLTDEYWTCNHVGDVDPKCHPDGYVANIDHDTCAAVRAQLLEAAGLAKAKND